MELDELELMIGESMIIDHFYIHRNEHAYIILRECIDSEGIDNALCIQNVFYRMYCVENLETYQLSDFE